MSNHDPIEPELSPRDNSVILFKKGLNMYQAYVRIYIPLPNSVEMLHFNVSSVILSKFGSKTIFTPYSGNN